MIGHVCPVPDYDATGVRVFRCSCWRLWVFDAYDDRPGPPSRVRDRHGRPLARRAARRAGRRGGRR